MAKENMTTWDWIAYVLLVVGGLNWGLVGIGNLAEMNLDLVQLLLGGIPVLRDIVYILVGLSAVYALFAIAKKK
ncbi:DUF378 domain-containing protein [Candidatus Woesearchaeota archaeon]|nr:DUF378 domain-containing protein [Candidatus Woesearchaeota archaeon]